MPPSQQEVRPLPTLPREPWELIILGIYWDDEKENGNYYNGLYRGYIGIMEKKMETTV